MATTFSRKDAEKVYTLLQAVLGKDFSHSQSPYEFLTNDNWRIMWSGWHINGVWQRSFMIHDNLDHGVTRRGHSPEAGDYEGRGWRVRLVNDMKAKLEELRDLARARALSYH